MRPAGEIRQVLGQVAVDLHLERQGDPLRTVTGDLVAAVTWRDLAERAQVGYSKAKEVVRDMARAGELRVVGSVRVAGAKRPANAYEPARAPAQRAGFVTGGQSLQGVLQGWRR